MGLGSKVTPFPAEVKLRGRQRGSKMEKRWGSKEGERSAHTHTQTDTLNLKTGWAPSQKDRWWEGRQQLSGVSR